MKNLLYLFLVILLVVAACTNSTENTAAGIVNLNVASFKTKMAEPNTIVLDVRTPAEIAAGKIPGAFDLDIQHPEFKAQVSKLDKAKTYLVYCQKGGRSGRACSILEEAGFEKIYNLAGGYDGWENEE